jgi:hypothetical protein
MVQATNYEAVRLVSTGGGGVGDLDTVLGVGNFTGGNDIQFDVVTSSDGIVAEDNPAGAGGVLNLFGSDAGGGLFNGGNIELTPGMGFGGGVPGIVKINGDLEITGSLTLSHLREGSGSPEGSEVAPISTIYCRTDGGAGNALYSKQAGAGNTGWCPMGPSVFENFVSVGAASFITSRAVFDDPVALGVENLAVFWNGVLQREGGGDDYTVVFGGASATITFTVTPPTSDLITIRYLPE